ncbi:hypothetical protein ECAE60S_00240 [Eoetvoesiella caeni]
MILRRITPLITQIIAAGRYVTVITPVTPSARPRDANGFHACVYTSHKARNPVTGVILVITLLKKLLGVIKSVISEVTSLGSGGFRGISL